MAKESPNKIKFNPLWMYAAVFGLLIFISFSNSLFEDSSKITISVFHKYLNEGKIDHVVVYNKTEAEIFLTKEAKKDPKFKDASDNILGGRNTSQPNFRLEDVGDNEAFQKELEKAVQQGKLKDFNYLPKSNLMEYAVTFLPIIIIVALWIVIMRRMSGAAGGPGGGQIFNIGKSRARLFDEKTDIKTTFKDVAGLEGAKEEIQEIVDFLKNPQRYTALGGKIPKGALLVGPPGTGKTLLAKAVAGEAGVPFFSLSGSDFLEMFVGVGASRVRDLFKQAKEKAPAIIFIDEIDAVGTGARTQQLLRW